MEAQTTDQITTHNMGAVLTVDEIFEGIIKYDSNSNLKITLNVELHATAMYLQAVESVLFHKT